MKCFIDGVSRRDVRAGVIDFGVKISGEAGSRKEVYRLILSQRSKNELDLPER